jgi:DNA-directed RNA polymerase subunit RPC12/RpoP
MALIKCPECEKEVSDSAISCPHCGFALAIPQETKTVEQRASSVVVTGIRVNSNAKKIIAGGVIVLIIAVIAVFIAKGVGERNSKREYEEAFNAYVDKLENFAYTSLSMAADVEKMSNLIDNVWYNAIYSKSDLETDKFVKKNGKYVEDFNIALANLFEDEDTIEKIAGIKSDQEAIKALWSELSDPPVGLEKCYEIADTLYETYKEFSRLSISASGSYNSYSRDTFDLDSNFIKYYDQLKDNIPDKF